MRSLHRGPRMLTAHPNGMHMHAAAKSRVRGLGRTGEACSPPPRRMRELARLPRSSHGLHPWRAGEAAPHREGRLRPAPGSAPDTVAGRAERTRGRARCCSSTRAPRSRRRSGCRQPGSSSSAASADSSAASKNACDRRARSAAPRRTLRRRTPAHACQLGRPLWHSAWVQSDLTPGAHSCERGEAGVQLHCWGGCSVEDGRGFIGFEVGRHRTSAKALH